MKESDNKRTFVRNLNSGASDVKRVTDDLFDIVNDDAFSINVVRPEVKRTQGISVATRQRIAFCTK